MTTQEQVTAKRPTEWENLFSFYHPLRIRYAPGEMICQAGSYIAGIHLILHGVVSDTMLSATKKPTESQILADGDLIGIEILDGNSDRLASSLCRAVTSVELLFVERKQLRAAIADYPAFHQSLVRYLVNRYVLTRRDEQPRSSVDSRLGRLLLQLSDACGEPADHETVVLPSEITPRVLSELMCISARQLRRARLAIPSLALRDSNIQFNRAEVCEHVVRSHPATGMSHKVSSRIDK